MKLGFYTLGLLTSLTFNQVVKAEDQHGHGHGHHHDIKGVETFVAHIALTPTDAAPGASGRLNMQSVNRNGAAVGQMVIQTFGLGAGDYNINASLKSGETSSLGTITVRTIHSQGHGIGLSRTANRFQLPDSLNPADISQVTVSDSNGTTDLVGDFVNLVRGSVVAVRANVRLAPGDESPKAGGNAVLSAVAVATNVTGGVTVVGSNLPTNTVLNVTANDQTVGTVTTTRNGSSVLRNLRNVSLLDVSQVNLTTTNGTTAATAGF